MAASTVGSFVDAGENSNVFKGVTSNNDSSERHNTRGRVAQERFPVLLVSPEYHRREKNYKSSKLVYDHMTGSSKLAKGGFKTFLNADAGVNSVELSPM